MFSARGGFLFKPTTAASVQAIAVGRGRPSSTSYPIVSTYPWNTDTGFGTKYTDPVGLITTASVDGYNLAFTKNFNALAIASQNFGSVGIFVYAWSSSGFGSKFSDPATYPQFGYRVAFTTADNALALGTGTAPYVYAWSGSGFGTRFTNPVLPINGNGVDFTTADNAIGFDVDEIYAWSGSGFGSKFSGPATSPTSTQYNLKFSPNDSTVAVSIDSGPRIYAYPWSGSGIGTKYADPATPLNGSGRYVNFANNNNTISVVGTNIFTSLPAIASYPWSNIGFGTKYSDPTTSISGSDATGVAFASNSDAIAISGSPPGINAYGWSGNGFGAKYTNPAILPVSTGPQDFARSVAYGIQP